MIFISRVLRRWDIPSPRYGLGFFQHESECVGAFVIGELGESSNRGADTCSRDLQT